MLIAEGINFCSRTADVWRVVGWAVVILKIVIPLILVILGMVDLGKAVISNDEKEINNAVGALLRRFIAAVVIFFLPSLITALFNMIHVTDPTTADDQATCITCITDVNSCPKQTNK